MHSLAIYNNKLIIYGVKGKAIPIQARTGPEDSRRLKLSDFKRVGI
jgi:hypothetical protein